MNTVIGRPVVLLAALTARAWCSAALAREAEHLAGKVVDPSGAAVSGARVWAVEGSALSNVSATAGVTSTDARGQFSIVPQAPTPGPERARLDFEFALRMFDVLVQAPDGRFGWQGRIDPATHEARTLVVSLIAGVEQRGWIVDQTGRPIGDACIVPVQFQRQTRGGLGGTWAALPGAASTALAARTAADGSFLIKGLPGQSMITARIRSQRHGSLFLTWTAGETVKVTVDGRLGTVTGRLRPPAGRKVEGLCMVSLEGNWTRFERGTRGFFVSDRRTVQVDADGRFQAEGLQPGLYSVNPVVGPDCPFVVFSGGNKEVTVEPGAVVAIPDIALEPAVTVTGRVIDAETKKGVPGVLATGVVSRPGAGMTNTGTSRTDESGRYKLKAAAGMFQVYTRAPPPYLVRRDESPAAIEIAGDRVWMDLEIARSVTVEGIVVDPAGKPVPDAELSILGNPHTPLWGPPPSRSGPDGRFRIEQLPPDGVFSIRVTAPAVKAVTDGAVVVKLKDQRGPLQVKVDPRFAFRLHGVVADASGVPIEGARVALNWTRQSPDDVPRRGDLFSGEWGIVTTDRNGRFDSGALIPGDRYTLSVTAKGHGSTGTGEIQGLAGQTRGLGTIKLPGTGGFIDGRVLGSGGRPIAGVMVFNRGNSLGTCEARTDGQGRFRLDRLFHGRKYAFVRKEGYRFTGVLVDGDRRDVAIRLLRHDEPPPAWKPEPGLSAEEGRELARRILVHYWERISKREEDRDRSIALGQLVLPMARVDPATALDWSAQLGGGLDVRVRLAAADVVSEFDAQAALEVIRKTNDHRWAIGTLIELARRYVDGDPSRAAIFAEPAAARIPELGEIDRPRARARLGAIFLDLGRQAEGRKLVEEAVAAIPPPEAAAGKPAASVLHTPGFLPTVRALARLDLPRARTVAERVTEPWEREQVRLELARAVGRTRPAKAMELLDKRTTDPSGRTRALIEIVYLCGDKHIDEAMKIVQENDHWNVPDRAEAMGWLAVAVARRDRPRAARLIDKALDLLLERANPSQPRNDPQGLDEAAAARVVLLARRAGYPDVDSVIARMLATRPPPHGLVWQRGQYPGSIVSLLALADPAVAREVLAQSHAAVAPPPGPDRDKTSAAADPLLIDRILADWRHAPELIDAALADDARSADGTLPGLPLIPVAEVLASSPARREEMLWGQNNDTWYPGRARPGE